MGFLVFVTVGCNGMFLDEHSYRVVSDLYHAGIV